MVDSGSSFCEGSVLLRCLSGLAFVAVALLVPAAAVAHSALASASPGPDDTIFEVPDELVARYTQNLDPARSSIDVRDADGVMVARGGFDESAPDERTMTVDLPGLAPGAYEVRWTTLSTEDGELERGTYVFTVAAATSSPPPSHVPTSTVAPSSSAASLVPQSPTPVPTPIPTTPSPSQPPGTQPTDAAQLVLPVIVVVVLAGVLMLRLARRRPG